MQAVFLITRLAPYALYLKKAAKEFGTFRVIVLLILHIIFYSRLSET